MSQEFWSVDRRYGLRFDEATLTRLREECRRAGDHETGGILVGRYSTRRDCAVVTEVVPPPTDSRRGRTWFVRGVTGLRALLAARWNSHRQVYLGEWHFHPGAAPDASGTDRRSITELAAAASTRCRVPVLVILGTLDGDRFAMAAWVAPEGGVITPLHLEVTGDDGPYTARSS